MKLTPRLLLGPLVALLAVLPAGARAADPSGEQLILTGALSAGTTSLTLSSNVYSFTFVGDETITYVLDLNLARNAGGYLKISESSSNSNPVDGLGFSYRDAAGVISNPVSLFPLTTLTGQSVNGTTLTLDYQLNLNGRHAVRYEFSLQKKQLRIRIYDPTGNRALNNNFNGIIYGDTTGVELPTRIQMQGALAQPITMFRNQVGPVLTHHFVCSALDQFQSNSSDFDTSFVVTPNYGSNFVTTTLNTSGRYKASSDGQLAAPLDDAYIVVVSRLVKDVLLTSSAPPSPYLGLLSNRMFVNCPERVWSWYDSMFDTYAFLGMHNLVAYFFEWSAGAIDPPAVANVGPDWSPAVDQGAFQAMLMKGRGYGNLVGAYTAFNTVPVNAGPGVYDPAEVAKDANGLAKKYSQLGFPLLGVEASANHVATELPKLKTLGANAAYLDIQTYGGLAQAPDGDHLDQQAASPWAKTHRQGFGAQKTWMETMRKILEGPLIGEGSIGTIKSNMEFLWTGYVDSVQRVINTASGVNASQLPFNSPFSPTNWPIIPEYEWRVGARTQINHGNGFYDRFFSKTDGDTIVDGGTGLPKFPLSQDAIDLYQAFLISYAHAGYITTNGIQSGNEGYLTHADAAETYFLTNALQWRYYTSPLLAIVYRDGGQWKTFEKILFATESTDSFRHVPLAMVFANGLHIYVNHGPVPLTIKEGGITYILPAKTGWFAGDGGILLSFSAIPPTTGGQRIDYCRALGQYEYFNGRGNVESYGTLTNAAKRSAWIDYTTNRTITEDQHGNLIWDQFTPPPQLTMIQLFPGGLTFAPGQRIGLRAIAFYDNFSIQDVTAGMAWMSTVPNVGTVNNSGVFEAVGTGTTTIMAVTPSGSAVALPINLSVL